MSKRHAGKSIATLTGAALYRLRRRRMARTQGVSANTSRAGKASAWPSIQGQDTRLESDAVDHIDNIDDLARAGIDGAHRIDHAPDHLPALHGKFRLRYQ